MVELIGKQDAINICDKYSGYMPRNVAQRVWEEMKELPPVQPEITQEQLEEYCKKRCLTVITDDLFYRLTSGKDTATWLIRKWGDDARCSNCGHTFKDVYDMDNHDRFCRFCGAKMIGVKGVIGCQ